MMICLYRYDGRGHLHDLWPYDADNVVNNADDLSAEEKKLEELCDEERYLELNTDVVEKAIYEGMLFLRQFMVEVEQEICQLLFIQFN